MDDYLYSKITCDTKIVTSYPKNDSKYILVMLYDWKFPFSFTLLKLQVCYIEVLLILHSRRVEKGAAVEAVCAKRKRYNAVSCRKKRKERESEWIRIQVYFYLPETVAHISCVTWVQNSELWHSGRHHRPHFQKRFSLAALSHDIHT